LLTSDRIAALRASQSGGFSTSVGTRLENASAEVTGWSARDDHRRDSKATVAKQREQG
jgi:hypothetical protein